MTKNCRNVLNIMYQSLRYNKFKIFILNIKNYILSFF